MEKDPQRLNVTRFLSHYFSMSKQMKKSLLQRLVWLWLWAFSLPATAATLSLYVEDGVGGHIAALPTSVDCAAGCLIEAPSDTLTSLFAIPDKGYRLQAWLGDCAATQGPLCTLKATDNHHIGVRFIKSAASAKPAKALLLLHGENERHTVWNEFAKQRFNNLCPIIYGGVVLGDDSSDPDNHVYCYRIAFGYYDLLDTAPSQPDGPATLAAAKPDKRVAYTRLGHEVRAAVLGITDRHPNVRLALVGQAQGILAAEAFLQTGSEQRKHVIGLLALQAQQDSNASRPTLMHPRTRRTATLSLTAAPEQDALLSSGLAQLTQSWWLAK
jgi:hypothetical protein